MIIRRWTDELDAIVERMYVEECASIGDICKAVGVSYARARDRIEYLSLTRNAAVFAAKMSAQKREAVARLRSYRQPPEEVANRDEDHWRLCVELGGFPVLNLPAAYRVPA